MLLLVNKPKMGGAFTMAFALLPSHWDAVDERGGGTGSWASGQNRNPAPAIPYP